MDEINELINKLLTEKTFSLEAVEVINNLKKTAEELTRQLKTATLSNEIHTKNLEKCRDENKILKVGNETLTSLVEEHNKLTEKYKESIIRAEFAAKGKEDLFRLTETIFKNDRVKTYINGTRGDKYVNYTAEQTIE